MADETQPTPIRGWPIRKRLTVWAIGSAAWAGIIALPDSDDRVVSFSQTHGPSLIDLAGVLLLLAAWAPIAAVLWSRRGALTGPGAWISAVLLLVGAGLLVMTIGADLGPMYLVAIVVLLVAQLVALRVIATHRSRP